jgi:predicted TIM-barrel fold metal-dependent hydrolase
MRDISVTGTSKIGGRSAEPLSTRTRRPLGALLPDPKPREHRVPLISVDDHFVEPGDVFTSRVAASLQDRVPRVVNIQDVLYWSFASGNVPLLLRDTCVVGRDPKDWINDPVHYEDLPEGAWNPLARVRDMDIAGIDASLCFPSSPFGFCGQRLSLGTDEVVARASVEAYNDWVIDEWVAAAPQRFIPQQVIWLGDPIVAGDEIRRNAQRGFTCVSFSENPQCLGLPSIHTTHWDPFFRACEESGTVINLHVGSSSRVISASTDAPLDGGGADVVTAILFPLNAAVVLADWLFSRIFVRFPELKVCLSESGIGWVPMMLERMDRRALNFASWDYDLRPSEIFKRNMWVSALDESVGVALRDQIGIDRIMIEVDYPHPDTTWPDTQATIAQLLEGADSEDIFAMSAGNASALYRHPLVRNS